VVDPHVIVLGGGMSNVDELYERLPDAMAPYLFTDRPANRIVRNRHGDASGVRGAAWLWPSEA
jgi:fructokinase